MVWEVRLDRRAGQDVRVAVDPYLDEIKAAIRYLRDRRNMTIVSYADLREVLCPGDKRDPTADERRRMMMSPVELANHLRDNVSTGRLVYHSIKGWYVP